MSKSLDKIEKDSASDESSDSKAAKSDSPVSQTKERRKSVKKKMLRSGNRRPRLSGGADEAAAAAAASESPQRVSIKEETTSQNDTLAESHSVPDTPPSSPVGCPKDTLVKTGDAKADEMLECALKNLEEAGKALASLGQNLEHELKLFLVDLMNRVRKWSSTVESKSEWTRRDIIALSKELASRMNLLEQSRRESQELRDQLAHSEERSFAEAASMKARMDQASIHGGVAGGAMDARSMQAGGMGGGAGAGVMDPCADPCGAAAISPCDQPPFVREGDTDIAAYKAEQERLMACCAELEEEICCLKKENERIVKERAEYENAIQRALLKGVSSLNVEALKVLRCTPIPSCCPPTCPPSTSIEPVSKSRDCTSPKSQQRDPCSGYNNGRGGASKSCSSSREQLNSRGNGGRVCPGTGHSERKSRKSKDNNMLLLLHQKDAENFGIQGGCDSGAKKSNDCGKHKKSHYQC